MTARYAKRTEARQAADEIEDGLAEWADIRAPRVFMRAARTVPPPRG